jgi:bifunctional UDP-N-acetylglucosamine pyrophosphorylase/glucosamine-1-phosphate N-acetyltransferase
MAAGKGKRLKSGTPKVLHPICGKPVLWHVLQAAAAARPDPLVVVVGHKGDDVEEAVRGWNVGLPLRFVDQGEPLGTGHAVTVAEEAVGRSGEVLVMNGDEPLVTGEQVRRLLAVHRRADVSATVQTTLAPGVRGLGHVVRDGDAFLKIVEAPRARDHASAIPEVATGIYVFRREDLFKALPLVSRDNADHEYYLVDVLRILREKGERIAVQQVDNGGAVGTNSRGELARATAVMRRRINDALMERGVTLIDPERTYIDVGVRIGPDTTILPDTYLEGRTIVGGGCTIGPGCRIADSTIADDVEVEASVVRGARIGRAASVGPFAHIRPGTVLGPKTKAGSFVEIKASRIGEGSKVPHLAYVGDATLGRNVNIGAGTVTVNYDGYAKHRTTIGDDARIGSDTMLIAPVRIGKGAVTGAGSVISKDVPAGALAVERGDQRTVPGYRERKDREKGRGATGGKS